MYSSLVILTVAQFFFPPFPHLESHYYKTGVSWTNHPSSPLALPHSPIPHSTQLISVLLPIHCIEELPTASLKPATPASNLPVLTMSANAQVRWVNKIDKGTDETNSHLSFQNLSFVLEGIHQVKFEDRPIPELKNPHDVLVNVKFTGICGSDVRAPRRTISSQ